MVALRLDGFSGLVPRMFKRLLQPSQAQVATNVRLTNGQLAPLRIPFLINSPGRTGLKSIFRMASSTGVEKWLTWIVDVDVARGPVAGDTTQRIYWTGDGEPRMSNFNDATTGSAPFPTTFYVLGAFPPSTAPTVVPTGGVSGTTEDRSYVYTFLTALSEESVPSPESAIVNGKIDATWAITAMDVAPLNTFTVTGSAWSAGIATLTVASSRGLRVGERITVAGMNPSGFNASDVPVTALAATTVSYAVAVSPGAFVAGGTITRVAPHNYTGGKVRLYRTVVAESGATEFRLVSEQAIGTTTYNDTIATSVVAEATLLASADWAMPPTGGLGIISMANGIMVGFVDNDVCFSEPFHPHAWPVRYRQTVKHKIVSIGWFGTTVVVATEGIPFTISGVEPQSMGGGAQGIEQAWPCLSKRGLVSTSFGVMYPTTDGLVLIGYGGADIATREFFAQDDWKPLMPGTFIASTRDTKYYAAYTRGDGSTAIFIMDKAEFASITFSAERGAELWTDPLSGKLYVVTDDKIYEWDSTSSVNALFDWFSKEFVYPAPINLAAARVEGEFSQTEEEAAALVAANPVAVAANAAIFAAGNLGGAANTRPMNVLAMNDDVLTTVTALTFDSLTFELWADNKLRYSRAVSSSQAFRLPSGYKSDNCAVRLSGNIRVTAVQFAESMTELRAV